jgi:eukaryotic-like serine/threonine-protein kinase
MSVPTIQLRQYLWALGEHVGGGGLGQVFSATAPGVERPAVVKLVERMPGAQRELLFAEVTDARNVIPVLDVGEDDVHYGLAMARADMSLRQRLDEGRLGEAEAVSVMRDVAAALADLDGRVVHRDLKPENVLLLDGAWCLADFGISRYAAATTAPDTRRAWLTHEYAAPEQWRGQRTTGATDVYAFGIMAYEMLAGHLPFPGPDFREQHLGAVPAPLQGIARPLAALVNQCLYKQPESRPSAADVLRRLTAAGGPPPISGLERLQAVHDRELNARAEAESRASQAENDRERHQRLFGDARRDLDLIATEVEGTLMASAPSIVRGDGGGDLWTLQLSNAVLRFSQGRPQFPTPEGMPFEVHAYSAIGLTAPGFNGYQGRVHSLWFCDAEQENRFGWYELAFIHNIFARPPGPVAPFQLDPNAGAVAITPGVGVVQLARNLSRLVPGELDEFIRRWGNWLADAAEGNWSLPSLPDEPVVPTWRGR